MRAPFIFAFPLPLWRSQIEVGNLIVINNREPVPCDVLIMGVDEPLTDSPAGIAYVETKSLDGETNLKIRQVRKQDRGGIFRQMMQIRMKPMSRSGR